MSHNAAACSTTVQLTVTEHFDTEQAGHVVAGIARLVVTSGYYLARFQTDDSDGGMRQLQAAVDQVTSYAA